MAEDLDLLSELHDEVVSYNQNSYLPSYIGPHWFQLAFDAIHSEVCGRGRWPHPAGISCNKRRKPETFNQDEWYEGSISELALQLIRKKFLEEGQTTVILAAHTDKHAANLALRHAARLLHRIQIRETEAGRITERITKIFEQRKQYFSGANEEKPYFSRDGKPPHPDDVPPKPLLTPIIRQLPLRPWIAIDFEEVSGSPYGNPALKIGATKILETVRSVGKWAIFDIFEDVLTFHQNVALSIGRGVPRADTEFADKGFEGNDIMDTQLEGLSDSLIKSAQLVAIEILAQWTPEDQNIWSLQGANSDELIAMGLSRQTHQNRLKKLVGKIAVDVDRFLEKQSVDLDFLEQQEFTLQVINEMNDQQSAGTTNE